MREPDKSGKSAWWRVLSACMALGRDRDGSVLFYTTLSLPVLVGFALLVIDGSRYMNLHSTVQHAADGLALTAAGELDRKADSLERAKLAVQTLIRNEQRFGDDDVAIVCPSDEDCDVTGRFLTELPPDDATPIGEWIAEDPSRLVANLSDNLVNHPRSSSARFVEITVKPQNLTTLMPAAFIGGNSAVAAQAAAVGGYTKGVCYFTPMMMCNPFENQTPDLFQSVATPGFKRRMIEMRKVGGDDCANPCEASYFPGNFTFLSHPAFGNGAKALREALAKVDTNFCFTEAGVDTKTGQNMGPVRQGLNVRFDIYSGPMGDPENGYINSSDYRPSMNVRKGFSGAACPQTDVNDGVNYQGLPRDNTVQTELSGGRIYTGDWDGLAPVEGVHPGKFEGYWAVNFPDIPIPNGWTNANPPSRYEVYRYEIENIPTLIDDASVGGETGEPMCYAGAGETLSDEPDRRILHAAIINCEAEGPLKGKEKNIPVYAFAKFFLIRPLATTGGDSIDVELVDVVEPPTDYQARDTVQLYR